MPHRAFLPFPDCRRILIVGGGGFGREVRCWVRDAWPAEDALFAGFLDGDPSRAGVAGPVLGDPDTYQPMPGDGLLLGVGIPGVRRRLAEMLSARGGAIPHARSPDRRRGAVGGGGRGNDRLSTWSGQ